VQFGEEKLVYQQH